MAQESSRAREVWRPEAEIITPEMIRRGGSVLTELQDAGCYQGYVLEKVYLAMRALEPALYPRG
jgi:hypothetical protein